MMSTATSATMATTMMATPNAMELAEFKTSLVIATPLLPSRSAASPRRLDATPGPLPFRGIPGNGPVRRSALHILTVICILSYFCCVNPAFAVLAEPNRRRILDLLADGERLVGDLVADLETSQPAVSKHLGVLGKAGFV